MIIRHPFAGLVVTGLFALAAASSDAAESLSRSQAVAAALRSNPAIASAQLSADAARQSARGARALSNPEVTLAPSIAGEAGADSALIFSQPLELNGVRKTRGGIAASQAVAAGFDADAARREIVLRVNQAYWDVARCQEFVKLNQENIAYLDSLNSAVQKQLDAGAVPGSQLIKTEVELAMARQELARAELELANAKASLSALMNRADNDYAATDPLTFTDTTPDRDALLASALSSRPEVAAAAAQVQAARGEIRAAKLRRAPDVALQARKGAFEAGSDRGVALAISLPLLDWGSVRADVRRAEITAESRQRHLEAVKTSLSLEVEQSTQLVTTSSRVVREYQSGILGRSEELAQMARTGYEKGATSYLEVLEAQRTLRSVKAAYCLALAEHAKSIAQLEWACGVAEVTK